MKALLDIVNLHFMHGHENQAVTAGKRLACPRSSELSQFP
jgi:hypothetical protein